MKHRAFPILCYEYLSQFSDDCRASNGLRRSEASIFCTQEANSSSNWLEEK